ncbi:SEL1-like repeat protein [Salinibius halmophilus]|uniref:hypothetical protein n=1 Tax=Salinibius halmophilus TaxID=1853216 RepID=UPI000E66BD2E|nr:hypothetical protein [Salinibius halmophilus]
MKILFHFSFRGNEFFLILWMVALLASPWVSSKDLDEEIEVLYSDGEFFDVYKYLLERSIGGDCSSQHDLAFLISLNSVELGIDVEKANIEVLYWLQKSASQGHSEAIEWISDVYRNGWLGIRKNEEVYNYWISKLDIYPECSNN